MASFAPLSAGRYLINATATGIKDASDGYLICRILDVGPGGSTYSATPWGYNNTAFTYGTLAEGGAVFNLPGSTVQERSATNVTANVLDATMTGTQISQLNPSSASQANRTRQPVNRFTVPAGTPTKGAQDRP